MLYNEDLYKAPTVTKAKSQPDPFSVGAVVAWLEMQDPSQEYDAKTPSVCLIAQYLMHIGFTENIGSVSADLTLANFDLARLAYGHNPTSKCTFGAAIERARAMAA